VPDGVQNIREIDGMRIASRHPCVVLGGEQQLASFQRVHDRRQRCTRQFQMLGDAIRGPTVLRAAVVAHDEIHDRERDSLPQARIQRDEPAAGTQVLRVLHIERQLRAQ
jgi:hypothetical protein